MNAKQYLKQAYRLDELIKSDKEELSKLRELSTSISSQVISDEPKGSTGTGSSEAKFAKIIEQIDELIEKTRIETSKYLDLKYEIKDKICFVNDKNEKLILQKRYLIFMTWESIAESMGFSRQWILELHKKALKTFSEMYNLY